MNLNSDNQPHPQLPPPPPDSFPVSANGSYNDYRERFGEDARNNYHEFDGNVIEGEYTRIDNSSPELDFDSRIELDEPDPIEDLINNVNLEEQPVIPMIEYQPSFLNAYTSISPQEEFGEFANDAELNNPIPELDNADQLANELIRDIRERRERDPDDAPHQTVTRTNALGYALAQFADSHQRKNEAAAMREARKAVEARRHNQDVNKVFKDLHHNSVHCAQSIRAELNKLSENTMSREQITDSINKINSNMEAINHASREIAKNKSIPKSLMQKHANFLKKFDSNGPGSIKSSLKELANNLAKSKNGLPHAKQLAKNIKLLSRNAKSIAAAIRAMFRIKPNQP